MNKIVIEVDDVLFRSLKSFRDTEEEHKFLFQALDIFSNHVQRVYFDNSSSYTFVRNRYSFGD